MKKESITIGADVGKRLKKVRLDLQLTLKDVYNMSGIAQSTISEMESGKRSPYSEYLSLLANQYKISLDWLFRGTGFMYAFDFDVEFKFGEDNKYIKKLINLIGKEPLFRYKMLETYFKYKKNSESE